MADNKIVLDSNNWIVLSDGLMDMPMDDWAAWIDAEREGRIRDVWPFLAQSVASWSFDGDPTDPASYGRLSFRQYREVSSVVAKKLQEIVKN